MNALSIGHRDVLVGVDLAEIRRVRGSIEKFGDRFLGRVFTDGERQYCCGRSHKLAARFAAKEAVAKALGTGIGTIGWRDIEVVSDSAGCPGVRLHGAAAVRAEVLGVRRIVLSISHTHDLAIAFVVAD